MCFSHYRNLKFNFKSRPRIIGFHEVEPEKRPKASAEDGLKVGEYGRLQLYGCWAQSRPAPPPAARRR
ncbi:hypothetical protein EVAR_43809_1 [Eumeta japonica]|uniref:Uncharacterized protein n=1 Tax=Eumeta variegata TaxID=151549 RepID=A0A4C1XUS3_EUMVA|nr:hypothetical protein EVAR_43809_1 [Eumeta japonica]